MVAQNGKVVAVVEGVAHGAAFLGGRDEKEGTAIQYRYGTGGAASVT